MRRVLATLVAAIVMAIFVPFANVQAAGYGSYVALGDSYTSGSLIPRQVDLLCTRSNRNYPSLVAQAIAPAGFTDVSCGGATTDHMTTSQFGPLTTPQFDALRDDTDLVTVGIGGNDIPFAEVVVTCATFGLGSPYGSPCKDHYNRGGSDQLAEKVRAVGPKLGAVLAGIRDRSPSAEIVLVGYPTIMPDSGASCWPFVPISAGDAPYLRDATKLLNDVLAEQAAAHGAIFVDTYRSSIGHDMCQKPGVKWVEGILLTSPAAPIHPNALGAKNQADQVLATLTESRVLA
ncbi:GDSL family lipase [Prauserella marina]|uniref:GDSL-like Lipase/Acylhydrolase family protein n=1 Tax=Prauserella marina TaxID=530584 RepID=A0A222VWF3_9PSEU|nr:SGNH/GDSL hydrolase family protein [Prauserella marina]ASR38235.1 GDSL family lipase [Prauserella marina]PWV78573.1 GDSL-like lipase/acylhydrolase family protein [Prauserella marina]SDC89095.1 GDSL-like Lipase/Acylhydrolase family protein [Prauserella marina]